MRTNEPYLSSYNFLSANFEFRLIRKMKIKYETQPPLNTDVLVLLRPGQIRVGQWNGTHWHVHADGLERFIFNVIGWMPLPEIKDFYTMLQP